MYLYIHYTNALKEFSEKRKNIQTNLQNLFEFLFFFVNLLKLFQQFIACNGNYIGLYIVVNSFYIPLKKKLAFPLRQLTWTCKQETIKHDFISHTSQRGGTLHASLSLSYSSSFFPSFSLSLSPYLSFSLPLPISLSLT